MNLDKLFEQKGIVEKSLNFYEQCARFAHVKQEGTLFRVMDLKEVKLNPSETASLDLSLQKLGIDSKTPLVTNMNDQKMVMRKLMMPPIEDGEILEALRFQFLEEIQSNQEMEIRFEKLAEENEEGMIGFIVYGLAKEQVDHFRKKWMDLKLNIIAAEPIATTLAAMTQILEDGSDKIRGVFYKEGAKMTFVGLKGIQILAQKCIGSRQEDQEVQVDWMIEFQQAIDEFLLQEKVSVMEEVLLVGSWSPEDKEKVLMTLGLPCRLLGEGELPQFVFDKPELKEKFLNFIPEIALATFPKAVT